MELFKRLIFSLLVFVSFSLSAQPINDNCGMATAILSLDGTCSANFNNTGATSDLNPTICNAGLNNNVWFSFVAQGVSASISVIASGGFDNPEISLISFDPTPCDAASFNAIDCESGVDVVVDNQLIIGNTYWVSVAFSADLEGDFQICIDNPVPAPNDACVNATPIATLDGTCQIFNNDYPSTEVEVPGCFAATGTQEVWFSFVAEGVSLIVDVPTGPGISQIAIMEFGSPCDFTTEGVIQCVNGGNILVLDNVLTIGNTYYIVVAFENNEIGDFELCVDNPPPAFNDDCMMAPIIPALELSDEFNCMTMIDGFAISNDYPSTDVGIFGCWANGDTYNVWYQFVAQGPDIDIDVTATNFPGVSMIALVEFTGGNICDPAFGIVVECQYDDTLQVDNDLEIGTTYYIAVGFDDNEFGDYCINVFNPAPPPNDTACAAIALTTDGSCNSPLNYVCPPDAVGCFTTQYANPDYPNNNFPANCLPLMQNNVFYTITLQDPDNVGFEINLEPGTADELGMMLLSFDDCTGNFSIEFAYCGVEFPVEYGPVDFGEVYYLIVGSSEAGAGTFNLCVEGIPPCFENNYCEDMTGGVSNAEDLGQIITFDPGADCASGSDQEFTCVLGCNLFADPEPGLTGCLDQTSPVVWYTFMTDGDAALLNITITSEDVQAPIVQFFLSEDGTCNTLTTQGLTQNNFECMVGSGGQLVANQSDVGALQTYYIAVSGANTFGGDFEICIGTIPMSAACVVDAEVQVTDRSFTGPLEGPFFPGEVVSVCLNVNTFQVSGANGCQWFQGISPVFGNGWDPSSFDANGQPNNSTMNGGGFPAPNVHNAGQFDWWTDVGYHFDHCYYQVGDFDGNGTLDMCNSLYDPDCVGPGITGGCCGPCWNTAPGTILPPGWFTSGVNGSCGGQIGWPAVDWGDGNTCSGNTGPWMFCFDLTVRSYPDCNEDETTKDLSIGFVSFADGEVGSWNGTASICGLDEPVSAQLPICCVDDLVEIDEEHDPLCAGGVFSWLLDYSDINPDVDFWEWTVDQPSTVIGGNGGQGGPNTLIIDNLTNTGDAAEIVIYNVAGFAGGECPVILLTITVEVFPEIQVTIDPLLMCSTPTDPYEIIPNISGGSGNFEYEWNDANQTTTANILVENPINGTQLVLTVSDDAGCESTAALVLNVYTTFNVDIDPSSLGQCLSDGPIVLDADASGGTNNFIDYSWDTPMGGSANGQSISAVDNGQHLVIVTDDQGCIGKDSVVVEFFDAPDLNISYNGPDLVICSDGDEIQVFSIVSGQFPFSYMWSGPSNETFNNFVFVDEAGIWTLSVEDANGCITDLEFEVTQADEPLPDLGDDMFVCPEDGLPDLELSDEFMFYEWSTGDEGTNIIQIDTPGLYIVTVTSNDGCVAEDEIMVQYYESPVIDLPDTLSFCTGQALDVVVGGNYDQYDWFHISGTQNDSEILISNEGLYILEVTDENGCTAEHELEVIESSFLTPILEGEEIICLGDQSVITVVGDYFSYEWRDVEGMIISSASSISTDTSGTFMLNVVDNFGCPGMTEFTVTVDDPSVAIAGAPYICEGSSTTLDAGAGYVEYLWSTDSTGQTIEVDAGGTYMVTVTNSNGCIVSDTVTIDENGLVPDITGDSAICTNAIAILDAGLGYNSYLWSTGDPQDNLQMLAVNTPGLYYVTVTDQFGCEGIDSMIVDGHPDPVANVAGDTTFCIGGMAVIAATGGFADYQWSTSVNDTLQILEVTVAGIYTVTVTDNNGCTTTAQMQVDPPYQETAEILGSLSYCIGNFTTLDAGANYVSYLWSDNSSNQTLTVTSPGIYAVTVVDANGCIAMDQVQVEESTELSPVISGDAVICRGDNTMLDAGAGFDTYTWSTTETSQTIMVTAGGTYTLTVTDAGGCTGDTTFTVQENVTPFATVATVADICNTSADGSILDFTAFVTAGDLNGLWADAGGSGVNLGNLLSVDFLGIIPGVYQFVYTTNSAVAPCVDPFYTLNVTVRDCNCPSAQVDPAPDLCNTSGDLDLNTLLQASTIPGGNWVIISGPGGGNPPSLNGSNFDGTGADPGDYTLMYQAPQGSIVAPCPDTSRTTLTINSVPNPGVASDARRLCVGIGDVIDLAAMLTSADIGGSWIETSSSMSTGGAFSSSTATFNTTGQNSGSYTFQYTVAGTDPCPDDFASVEVILDPLPTASAGLDGTVDCLNRFASLDGSGSSQGDFTYLWTTIDGSIESPNVMSTQANSAGTYALTVTNNLTGCVNSDTVVVMSIDEQPTDMVLELDAPICEGEGFATVEVVQVIGGTPNYTYSLNGGASTTNTVFENLLPGDYLIEVTDETGCTFETGFNVPSLITNQVLIDGELFIEEGDSMRLSYSFNGGGVADSVVWKDHNNQILCIGCDLLVFYPDTNFGTVLVEAYDENGCLAIDQVQYRIAFKRIHFIPNVYSPNGDGQNDFFNIFVNDPLAVVAKMEIYSRWGEQLFSLENFPPNIKEVGWDGRFKDEEMMPGVYVYHIVVNWSDGFVDDLKGDITLMR